MVLDGAFRGYKTYPLIFTWERVSEQLWNKNVQSTTTTSFIWNQAKSIGSLNNWPKWMNYYEHRASVFICSPFQSISCSWIQRFLFKRNTWSCFSCSEVNLTPVRILFKLGACLLLLIIWDAFKTPFSLFDCSRIREKSFQNVVIAQVVTTKIPELKYTGNPHLETNKLSSQGKRGKKDDPLWVQKQPKQSQHSGNSFRS